MAQNPTEFKSDAVIHYHSKDFKGTLCGQRKFPLPQGHLWMFIGEQATRLVNCQKCLDKMNKESDD